MARRTTDGAWPQWSRATEVVSGLDTSERKKVTPTRQAHLSAREKARDSLPVRQEEREGSLASFWAGLLTRATREKRERCCAGLAVGNWNGPWARGQAELAVAARSQGREMKSFPISKPMSNQILNANSNQFEI